MSDIRHGYPFDARRLLTLFDPETPDGIVAEALGVSRRAVNRWRNDRDYRLHAYAADRYAIRVGVHPSQVWPEWWQVALAAV